MATAPPSLTPREKFLEEYSEHRVWGWDFPLARNEKVQRLALLLETQVQQSVIENEKDVRAQYEALPYLPAILATNPRQSLASSGEDVTDLVLRPPAAWEYPLSRDEKVQRLFQLYEDELVPQESPALNTSTEQLSSLELKAQITALEDAVADRGELKRQRDSLAEELDAAMAQASATEEVCGYQRMELEQERDELAKELERIRAEADAKQEELSKVTQERDELAQEVQGMRQETTVSDAVCRQHCNELENCTQELVEEVRILRIQAGAVEEACRQQRFDFERQRHQLVEEIQELKVLVADLEITVQRQRENAASQTVKLKGAHAEIERLRAALEQPAARNSEQLHGNSPKRPVTQTAPRMCRHTVTGPMAPVMLDCWGKTASSQRRQSQPDAIEQKTENTVPRNTVNWDDELQKITLTQQNEPRRARGRLSQCVDVDTELAKLTHLSMPRSGLAAALSRHSVGMTGCGTVSQRGSI